MPLKALILPLVVFSLAAPAAARPGEAEVTVERSGARPPTAGPAGNFTGSVRVASRFQREAPARAGGGLVTFAPAARTAWHSHPLGQTLFVTSGKGLVQHWGGLAQEIRPGDVVWIPPGVKHWHGAGPTTGMSHFAVTEVRDGQSTIWMEHVSDTQYAASASREQR